MKNCQLFALPGFMGHRLDWETADLEPLKSYSFHPLGIQELCQINPERGLTAWGDHFQPECPRSFGPAILLGYSLGGRLGLHSILQKPSLWDAAILVSAHSGLKEPDERQTRLAADESWAKRFENEDWHFLLDEWNAQAVFKTGSYTFQRKEEDYSREQLAAALRHWSLGKQNDLTHDIQKSTIPILWIAGEKDMRYAKIAEGIQLRHKKSCKWIASNAGHRVPWEQPKAFVSTIQVFIDSLYK